MSGNKKYLLRIISQNRYFIIFYKMLSGSKAPDFDAYGLLRATHSHNPTQSSHIVGLSSYFYAHIGAKGLSPTYEQAHVGLDLLTLAS